jgi:Zn-dependent peptidase ImmA (M78 family)
MSKARSVVLAMSREAYRNPYAHIEELEQDYLGEEEKLHRPKPAYAAVPDPEVFHNPYLFVDNEESEAVPIPKNQAEGVNDDLAAASIPYKTEKKQTYSDKDIQKIVRYWHRHIWVNRKDIWGSNVPKDPVEMLEPKIVANLLGFSYQEESGIGIHQTSDGDAEVAGLIDDSAKAIYVSHQLKSKPRRFTAAHEIGHAALHDLQGRMHRDRSEDFQRPRRDQKEREADRFATYFLMPENLVVARFLEIFHIRPFQITSETAFALGLKNANELAKKCRTRRELARLLASTERFNFEHFESLANQFHVSTEAMAIRIEELGLV